MNDIAIYNGINWREHIVPKLKDILKECCVESFYLEKAQQGYESGWFDVQRIQPDWDVFSAIVREFYEENFHKYLQERASQTLAEILYAHDVPYETKLKAVVEVKKNAVVTKKPNEQWDKQKENDDGYLNDVKALISKMADASIDVSHSAQGAKNE